MITPYILGYEYLSSLVKQNEEQLTLILKIFK